MAQTAYDKVASVIGEEMDKAWKTIMERLAGGRVDFLAADGGPTITKGDLDEFFARLGGAHLGVSFSCLEPKGETSVFTASKLKPQSDKAKVKGLSGEITIGGTIRF